jgi:quercetin dioxygenase-like cupin family protein
MSRRAAGLAFVIVLLSLASVVAQTPAAGALVLRPIAAGGGHGVSNAALIDQAEVRVLRVDIEPGGVRNRHTHDDVRFHLLIPISGTVSFDAGSGAPVSVAPWQAQFMPAGTPHGFRNQGTSTVSVMEVFVRK